PPRRSPARSCSPSRAVCSPTPSCAPCSTLRLVGMARTRFASDTARANWSSLIGAALGIGVALLLVVARGDHAQVETVPFLTDVYLVMWPTFTTIYILCTHLVHARSSPRALRSRALSESRARSQWWTRMLSFGGASSCTLTAALV